jgi:hypothetical protein
MLQRPAFAAAFLTLTCLCGLNPPAGAQVQRQFPQNALRGELVIEAPPEVRLNGRLAQLAPAARIRTQTNMVELSGALIGARLIVNYTLDPLDLVKDVWILSPEEAAKRPWPTTPQQAQSWVFDPVAQVWSRP